MTRAARKKGGGRRGKATGIVKVDLSGVETRKTPAEDEYAVKVKEVEEKEGDKAPYLAWTFLITEGKFEDAPLYINTSLSENSLWNLKALLEALGVDIPEEAMDLDLSEMVDLEMMVTVEHETYQSKKQARIVDFWASDEGDGKKKKGKGGDKPDEDEVNEMDEDDLAKIVKKFKLDIDLDDFPKIKKARVAVLEALDDAGDDDDDKKKGGKKKKGKKETLTEDEVRDMDEDELGALLKEHKIKDVDLDDFKSLKKQQAAVVEALTEAGMIEED